MTIDICGRYLISMTVTNQDVAFTGNVNAVGKFGDKVGRNFPQQFSLATDDNNGMTLMKNRWTL